MASKSADMSVVASRRAQKEAMLTRHKSAQSKRQLRKKDRTIKLSQSGLKSPPNLQVTKNAYAKTYKSPKMEVKANPPKSPKKLAECIKPVPKSPRKKKIQEVIETSKEYLPNKKKRLVFNKKIVLKSKHELKIVEGLNKRKRTTPKKDLKFSIPLDPPTTPTLQKMVPEPSFDELLRLADDMEEMTDEDLMEILTCPSPVWWEEPVNPDYEEDPIFPRPRLPANAHHGSKPPTTLENNIQNSKTSKTTAETGLITELKEKGSIAKNKIIKKRYLESILSNIKKKVNESTPYSDNDKRYLNAKSTPRVETISLSESSATEDELFTDKNEDILKDLENLEIPVENTEGVNRKSAVSSPVECIFLDDDGIPSTPSVDSITEQPISEIEDKFEASMQEGNFDIKLSKKKKGKSLLPQTMIWTINTNDKKTINLVNDEKIVIDHEDTETNRDPEAVVPDEMPPLKKFTKISENEIASLYSNPPNNDSFEMDAVDSCSTPSSREPDTISDTNIKFLTDEQVNSDENVNDDENHDPLALDIETDLEGQKQNVIDTDLIKQDKELTSSVEQDKKSGNARKDADVKNDNPESKRERIVVYKIVEADSGTGQPALVLEHGDYVSDKSKTTKENYKSKISTQNSDKVNKKTTHKIVKVKSIRKKQGNVSLVKRKDALHDVKIPITYSEGPRKAIMHYCRICSSIFDTPECKYCRAKTIQNNSLKINKQ